MNNTNFDSLDSISRKQLNELENCVRELLGAMKKSKLMDDPLVEPLKALEQKLGKARRARFDVNNPEYKGF